MDTNNLRALVANLILQGDFRELMHLYAAADVSLSPEALARVYDVGGLSREDRAAFDEITAALADDLLPRPGQATPAPAEMVELVGRCAAERGRLVSAAKAFQEVDAVEKYRQLCADFAAESLNAGDYEQAAFELTLAGRLGWAQCSPEERMAFLVGLGIDPNELASALGAERAKGRLSGGRSLADFPALQTYGTLLHARCGTTGCPARRPLAETVPLAVRLLIHHEETARRALEIVGDQALKLLTYLARETDPELDQYAEAHERATERFRPLQAEPDAPAAVEEPAAASEPDGSEPEPSETAEEGADEAAEERRPEEGEEQPSKSDELRAGLEEVQRLLLGRPEKLWRNCLAELALRHPLSLFTVCTARAGRLGSFVVPVGEAGREFLTAVRGKVPDGGEG